MLRRRDRRRDPLRMGLIAAVGDTSSSSSSATVGLKGCPFLWKRWHIPSGAPAASVGTLVSWQSRIGTPRTFSCAVSDRPWLIAARDPDVPTWLEYDIHAATHRALPRSPIRRPVA